MLEPKLAEQFIIVENEIIEAVEILEIVGFVRAGSSDVCREVSAPRNSG